MLTRLLLGAVVGLFCLFTLLHPRENTPELDPSTQVYSLDDYAAVAGKDRHEKVLLCVPLRDAADHVRLLFSHLRNLTYPHALLDVAFLISDSSDDTLALLEQHAAALQADPDPDLRFRHVMLVQKDFGQIVGQGFSDRHGFAAQGPRRKLMGRARNWLLTTALKPDHSWVYWRDADIESSPPTIIEDLMRFDKDVIVPNVWRPLPEHLGGEQPYDLNSWQESEAGLELAKHLPEDAVIVEGYAEYATWRPHLAYAREKDGNPDDVVDLDGVGGVSILAKARVFRAGAMFPGFAFRNHAETEGFGVLCRAMHFSVAGLPHYVIWHVFEQSADDIEADRKRKQDAKKAAAAAAAAQRKRGKRGKARSGKAKGAVDPEVLKQGKQDIVDRILRDGITDASEELQPSKLHPYEELQAPVDRS